jgi:molybdenum cofactor synthesis domain-containing protein
MNSDRSVLSADKPNIHSTTAAFLIIGNEVLSGKVRESNLMHVARLCRNLGIALQRVVIVVDDEATIAREVRTLADTHDWLITSGGVGPTHDDVTLAAMARAFERPLELHPELVAIAEAHPGHARLAYLPRGTALHAETRQERQRWPAIRVENVWVLPGVPQAFERKLAIVEHVLETRLSETGPIRKFVSLSVYTKRSEGTLLGELQSTVDAFPTVDIGSYPQWHDTRYANRITFDGKDRAEVQRARDHFAAQLAPEDICPEQLFANA